MTRCRVCRDDLGDDLGCMVFEPKEDLGVGVDLAEPEDDLGVGLDRDLDLDEGGGLLDLVRDWDISLGDVGTEPSYGYFGMPSPSSADDADLDFVLPLCSPIDPLALLPLLLLPTSSSFHKPPAVSPLPRRLHAPSSSTHTGCPMNARSSITSSKR